MAAVERFLQEVWISRGLLGEAFATTVLVAFVGFLLGLAGGLLLSLASVFGSPWVRRLALPYIYLMRGVPLLVIVFFVYFGLATAVPGISETSAGVIALALFSAAPVSEIFRGAFSAIPPGQYDAAKAVGLPFLTRLRDVLLPLALENAVPSLTNVAVEMVKASTLVSALGATDLLLATQQITARTFMAVEFYALCWGLYLVLNLLVSYFGRVIERRYARYRLVETAQ